MRDAHKSITFYFREEVKAKEGTCSFAFFVLYQLKKDLIHIRGVEENPVLAGTVWVNGTKGLA